MAFSTKLDFTKLRSLEEYAEVEHDVPYSYSLRSENCALHVFGADHSNDPLHPQFSLLTELFERTEPGCVLIEGLQDEVLFSHLHTLLAKLSPKEAVAQGGESVYAAALALESGATWKCIEPADVDLCTYVESLGFSRQHIVTWYALRLLPQYIRREETVHFADYLEPF